MSLELNPEIEKVVRQRAEAEGISVNDLLARTFANGDIDSQVTDPKAHVRKLLAEWRAQDSRPILPSITTENGMTPTKQLFKQWEAEDAAMTEEEQAAEERFWEEFQQGIDAERREAGMRTLY